MYRLYLRLIEPIRASRQVHRLLFGYRPCRDDRLPGGRWDWTTLVIRKAMRQLGGELESPDPVMLDMGTGPAAVLAISAQRQMPHARVHAVDLVPAVLSAARRNARALKLPIQFVCSDLFAGIRGRFDWILFNAPYLDESSERQRSLPADPLYASRFGGGAGGTRTIARFLREAPEYLRPRGMLILGVNHYHVARSAVDALIAGSGWTTRRCVRSRFLPACAYVLQAAETDPAEGGA